MMCWKKILCLSLLLQICFLLFALTASAAHLSGEWQYREARWDASELQIVQSAAQGARDWKSFAFPAPPPFAEGTRKLYETTQVLPGGDEDTLLFFTTGEKVRVFLDEKLVYTYDETVLNSAGGGRMWHLVHLPQVAHPYALTLELSSGDPHTLGVYWSFSLGTEQRETERIFLSDMTLILTLPVAVCMLCITALFYWREHRDRRLYRTLLTFLGNFILWGIAALNTKYFLTDAVLFWWYVLTIAAYFLPITAYAIVYEVLKGRERRVVGWFIRAFFLLLTAALLLEFSGMHGLGRLFLFEFVLMASFGPFIFWWCARAARQGDDYCRSLLVPIILFTLFGILDGVNTYLHFLPGDMFLCPFGIYGIAVFLLAILKRMTHREETLGERASQLRSAIVTARDRETHDPLTHALSRAAFRPLLERYLVRAEQKQQAFSLIMFDIDHFKQVNDTYGHEAGDSVLVRLTQAVRANLASRYPILRWGGEEFFVFCPEMTLAAAAALAEILRSAARSVRVAEPVVTASFGVASYHGASDTADALCARVDAALYAAKQGGRDRVVCEAQDA